MGIKTPPIVRAAVVRVALKNLPTTWGLRHCRISTIPNLTRALKNLPTTWGLRLLAVDDLHRVFISEKPPHHMGIKTN